MKLTWDTESNKHFEFDDHFGTTAKKIQPTWYQNLTFWRWGRKSWRELIAFDTDKLFNTNLRHESFKSAKGCPAFINFFKQSVALKTPTDMFFRIYQSVNADTEQAEWFWEYNGSSSMWEITGHADWQTGKLAENNFAIKFSLHATLIADCDTQFQYVDPYIANKVDYRVVPGVVSLKKGSCAQINMVTLFEKKEGEYWIPAGSTLGYVQFDKVIRKITHKDHTKEMNKKSYFTFEKGDHNEYLSK